MNDHGALKVAHNLGSMWFSTQQKRFSDDFKSAELSQESFTNNSLMITASTHNIQVLVERAKDQITTT